MPSKKIEYDPDRLWLNPGTCFDSCGSRLGIPLYNRSKRGWFLSKIHTDGTYELEVYDEGLNESLGCFATPNVLLQIDPVTLGSKTKEGQPVNSVRVTWTEIVKQIQQNRQFLFEFTKASRIFEMFMAGTYRMDGFDEVLLTPRSDDGGRDVIAAKRGLRILEQSKAYKSSRHVTHNEFREMIGVLTIEDLPSCGAITTTSTFAPKIYESKGYQKFVPEKLCLRNGDELCSWLNMIVRPTVDTRGGTNRTRRVRGD